jgi:hypothetical protein
MNDRLRTNVVDVMPSYYWPGAAIVIVTECGHKHVRPASWGSKPGDTFDCAFDHPEEHKRAKAEQAEALRLYR